MDLPVPACVKNSEHRFVAVNDAYAALFGRMPHEFIRGFESDFRKQRSDDPVIEAEILSTGVERQLGLIAIDGKRHRFTVERFISDDGSAYLYFEQDSVFDAPEIDNDMAMPEFFDGNVVVDDLQRIRMALEDLETPIGIFAEDGRPLIVNTAWRSGRRDDDGHGSRQIGSMAMPIDQALGLLDIGIGIFDGDNRLIHANARLFEFVGPVGGLPPGASLEAFFSGVYDYSYHIDPIETVSKLGSRSAYVEQMHREYSKPFRDVTIATCDGRYIRTISRRLDNNILIFVRSDVTKERLREQELATNLARVELFRNAFDGLAVATIIRDERHQAIFVNEAYCHLFGLQPADVLGKTEAEVFTEDGPKYFALNDHVLRTGALTEVEETVTRPDGQMMTLIARMNRIVGGRGEHYVVGSLTPSRVVSEGRPQGDRLRSPRLIVYDPDPEVSADIAHRLCELGVDCRSSASLVLLHDITSRPAGDLFAVDAVIAGPTLPDGFSGIVRQPVITFSQIEALLPESSRKRSAGQPLVLLAEDDPATIIVYERILASLGLAFVTAKNGTEVIEAWQNHRPDLILMDVTLAEFNGYEVTSAIRAFETAAGYDPVPIVALLAPGFESERQRCFDAGMNDCLLKPITPQLMQARLSLWLVLPETQERSST